MIYFCRIIAINVLAGIMALFFIIIMGIPLLQLLLSSAKGWAGEKLVAHALKQYFPKGTVIFNDLYFHNGRRSCQIDHLVVSPDGIFVIETKNYLGLVYGDASDHNIKRKVFLKQYKTYNPAKQNEYHLDYLRRNLPIIASCADTLRSIIVFAGFTKLRLRHNSGNIGTLLQLPDIIKRYSLSTPLSATDCRRIADEIRYYNRR